MKKTISLLLSIVVALSVLLCLSVSVSAANVYETEDNDSVANADRINFGDVVTGKLSDSYDEDYYSITVTQKGYISINISNAYNDGGYWSVHVYRYDNGTSKIYDANVYRKTTSHDFPKIGVEPGTYIILIDYGSTVSDVEYKLTVNHTTTNLWESEHNDDINSADSISLGYTYGGFLEDSYDMDYYSFYVSQKGYLNINISNEYNSGGYWSVYICRYDNGSSRIYNANVYRNVTSHDFPKIGVEPGTYIIYFEYGSEVADVEYSFTVNHVATDLWESEHNSDVNKADAIALGNTYGGYLDDSFDSDYYILTVDTSGCIGINLSTEYDSSGYWSVYLYKFTTSLERLSYGSIYRKNCGGSLETVYVEPGTYYVEIEYGSSVSEVEYYLTCNIYDNTPVISIVDGTWYCLINGEIAWDYTGLVWHNNTWYYVANGVVDWNYTGIVLKDNVEYYIVGGVFADYFTGMADANGTKYLVENGIHNWQYNGLYYDSVADLTYLLKEGKVNWDYYGIYFENNVEYYITNGYHLSSFTGMVDANGTKYLVVRGIHDWQYNGLYYDSVADLTYLLKEGKVNWDYYGIYFENNVEYYITNGYHLSSFTGMVDANGTKYLVVRGIHDWQYNGLYYDSATNTTYLLKEGKVNWDYVGFIEANGEWYWVEYGTVNWSKNGLVLYSNEFFYVENGKVNWDKKTLAQYDGAWFYVENGKVNWNYNGLVEFNGDWCYIINGYFAENETTLVFYNNDWYYVENGKINWNSNTLILYNNEWFYARGGVIAWDYTGLVEYCGGYYYVQNGCINWGYTGLTQYYGGWYYVTGGYLDWSVTTLTEYYGTWYYVENGAINWNSNTLVNYYGSWYYTRNGVVDWNYTGYIWYGGARYYITNGFLDWSRQ